MVLDRFDFFFPFLLICYFCIRFFFLGGGERLAEAVSMVALVGTMRYRGNERGKKKAKQNHKDIYQKATIESIWR